MHAVARAGQRGPEDESMHAESSGTPAAATERAAQPIVRRRDVLAFGARLAGTGVLAALAAACSRSGGPLDAAARCLDPNGLSAADRSLRSSVAYVDAATSPDRRCSGCAYFTATPPSGCGTCQVVPGGVAAAGYCTAWTAHT